MSFIPKPHEIYKHFKGNLYQVTAIAEHTETGEQLVVYQALYGDFLTYARPLAMFVSKVDREKYPDAVQEFRFELQGPEAGRQRAESREVQEEASMPGGRSGQTSSSGSSMATESAASMHGEGSGQASSSVSLAATDPAVSMPGEDSGQKSSGISSGAVAPAASMHGSASDQTMSEIRQGAMEQKNADYKEEDEISIDPLVLEFLDADSYGEQLNILAALHHRITDEMITTMAIACDIEINEGDIEERYEALKTCLLTLERYECNRLR